MNRGNPPTRATIGPQKGHNEAPIAKILEIVKKTNKIKIKNGVWEGLDRPKMMADGQLRFWVAGIR